VSFSMMLNSSIHVLMYSYYFISSLGQFWQKKINKWKPIITVLQMVKILFIKFLLWKIKLIDF
jgi:hypothetical protein